MWSASAPALVRGPDSSPSADSAARRFAEPSVDDLRENKLAAARAAQAVQQAAAPVDAALAAALDAAGAVRGEARAAAAASDRLGATWAAALADAERLQSLAAQLGSALDALRARTSAYAQNFATMALLLAEASRALWAGEGGGDGGDGGERGPEPPKLSCMRSVLLPSSPSLPLYFARISIDQSFNRLHGKTIWLTFRKYHMW